MDSFTDWVNKKHSYLNEHDKALAANAVRAYFNVTNKIAAPSFWRRLKTMLGVK
jgi:hypothetical protein